MNGKFLLDTNIVIALFSGDTAVQDKVASANEIIVPAIVLGELYFGARKSSRVQDNLDCINNFAASCAILSCDSRTAWEYGLIKNQLREKGHPIPENDIWIAALARQYKLILVTRDKHFDEVEDIELQNW